MTDAGGTPSEGSVGKSVGSKAASYSSNGKSGGGAAKERHPAKEIVWSSMSDGKVLKGAFSKSELAILLKQLALFTEVAAAEGMAGVCRGFAVRENVTFPALLAKIRDIGSAHTATEFLKPAKGAMLNATSAWAMEIVGRKNPAGISVSKLVEAIQQNPQEALRRACALVLRNYGERLILLALPRKHSSIQHKLVADFADDLDRFVQSRPPTEWGTKRLIKTLQAYESNLVSES